MNDVVQPVSVDPLVWQDDVRFSKLVVDIVQGQDTLHHVMYIGTGNEPKSDLVTSALYFSFAQKPCTVSYMSAKSLPPNPYINSIS